MLYIEYTELHLFLGVIPTFNGLLLLSQHRYICELLERHRLDGIKDSVASISTTECYSYPMVLPLLMLLNIRSLAPFNICPITHLDIGFAVNISAQYMHVRMQTHWSAAKRLLRYLKHTFYCGLHLSIWPPFQLTALSDSN